MLYCNFNILFLQFILNIILSLSQANCLVKMGNECHNCVNLSSDKIYFLITQKLLAYQHLNQLCTNYQSLLQLIVQCWQKQKDDQTYYCFDHTIPYILSQNQISKQQKFVKQQNAIVFMKKQYLYIGKIKQLKYQGKGILYSYVNAGNNLHLRSYEGNFAKGQAEDIQAKFIIYNQKPAYSEQSLQVIFKNASFQKGVLKKCELHHHNQVYSIKINRMTNKNGVQNINARIIFPDQQTIYEGDIVKQSQGFYKLEGTGQLIYPNKNYYIGEFKNNKFQGKGVFYFINGKKYDGFYKNGLKHGIGKFYPQSGTHPDNYLQTDWHNGTPQGQAISYPAKIKLKFQKGNVFSTIEEDN